MAHDSFVEMSSANASGGEATQRLALVAPPSLRSRSSRTRRLTPGSPLERISIELARRCNLACTYCYSRATARHRRGLTDEELGGIASEAVTLGARLISIVGGGEPLLRRSLTVAGESLIDLCNALGCYCYLYTNGTLIDERTAHFLAERDVSVVGKLNSLRPEVQDALAGIPGTADRIRRGVDALLGAGMAAASPSRLALETIICPENYDEIPDLWHFMRRRNIIPEIEIPTLHGRAGDNRGRLAFTNEEAPRKYGELFAELSRIDRAVYGYVWEPHPPFPAASCRLFENNCYIDDEGHVQPCAGVDRALGQLRVGSHGEDGRSLQEIVTSPEFRILREVRRRVQAPCRGCDLIDECYGCRGAAYQATGDMFAADPVCWRRQPRKIVAEGSLGCSICLAGK